VSLVASAFGEFTQPHDVNERGRQAMASYDALNKRVQELHDARFKEFEQELLRLKALAERAAKGRKEREKLRRKFMESIGTDLKKLDAAVEEENRAQEAALQAFLKEFRRKSADRPPLGAADAKDAAIRSGVLAETGHMVLPVFASSIIAPDKGAFADIDGVFTGGVDDSGWVFPDNPSKIRVVDIGHYPNALCSEVNPLPPAEFSVYFSFTPATTATFKMTAVLAFHGFYVLRCDDSWWNCRDSGARLTVRMNVNQYTETGWHDFPSLLDVEKDNAEEVTSYDRSHFFDYTTGLRGGDPVVVTVAGTVDAYAHGGGAYAELNFAAGTANYIQPELLAVQQV
jgi:hypothetical protein